MDRKIMRLYLIVCVILMSACSQVNPEEKQLEEISKLEKKLFEDEEYTISDETLVELTDAYEAFVQQFPQHEKSPEYLFRRADLLRALGEPLLSARTFERLYHDYPDYAERPQVLFLIGFTYENEVGDDDEASYWYNRFLEEYPAHHLAQDVQHSLRYIGRPIEDLIREWEMREKKNESTVAE